MFKTLSLEFLGDVNIYSNKISGVLGIVGGFLISFLGGYDTLLVTLITLIVLDYITGLIKGIYEKNISSEIGYKGIIKKFLIVLIVGVSVAIQTILPQAIPLREITIMFFICNEGISILENCATMIPLPDKIKEVLLQLKSTTSDVVNKAEENQETLDKK